MRNGYLLRAVYLGGAFHLVIFIDSVTIHALPQYRREMFQLWELW